MFFAGMALGAVAGTAFGIGMMCCVVAGKQEDQQMERMRRQKEGEPKTIHFRDREGRERFSLLDGESLCMMAEDGTKEIGICRFVDGNGRVGRLIMFKECLKYNIVPFIIEDNLKMFYYRGLKEWDEEKGYLMDTCLMAQDQYKAYLDYFRIEY